LDAEALIMAMTTSEKLDSAGHIALHEEYGAHIYHPLDVVISRAQGVWAFDVEGNRYLDCLAAYSAVNQGHCHPRLYRVMLEQAQKVTLTSRAFYNDQLGPFCKEICDLLDYERLLPMNSGAEGVESALKLARKWGYTHKGIPEDKAEIIAFSNNFHGRTISIISFSTEEQYRAGFGPFTPGFVVAPFGDLDAVRQAINPNTAAVLVEPIQGEGGVNIPPAGFLAGLAELCRQNNVLLIADEIQTGLGRTGRLLACDHEQVKPDILILGKALSAGYYPISVVLASGEIMDVFRPGDHGSTFGGNPLAAAIGREAVRVLLEEGMIENAAEQGAYFKAKLAAMPAPKVKEVRGVGLLIGIELFPDAGGARRACELLKDEGILCKETHDHVLRVTPPLIITREEVDWALERFARVLTDL